VKARRGSKVVPHPAKPILGIEASATLRDRLLEELKIISSPEDAALWARRILGTKNSLTEVDASQVEDAFQAKLATFDDINRQSSPPTPSAPRNRLQSSRKPPRGAGATDANGIDRAG
jgi:hypothetical protein